MSLPASVPVVLLASAGWETPAPVNAHQVARRLAARGHRVLFVESVGLRPPAPLASGHDLRRIAARLRGALRGLREVEPRLYVLSPLVPLVGPRALRRLALRALARGVARAARRLGFEAPVLWAFLPTASRVAERLPAAAVVYHCVDHYAANPGVDAPFVDAEEGRLLERADLVLASSSVLAERLRAKGAARVRLVPNVADVALFARAHEPLPEPAELRELPHPRAIYVGNLAAYRVDFALLAAVARSGVSLVLVGPIGLGDAARAPGELGELLALPGVRATGPRPPEALPAFLRHADVALIPFLDNDHTRGSFPLKVWEYLAAGLPVVATPLPSLVELAEPGIALARGPEAFTAAVRAAAGGAPEVRLERLARARARLARPHRGALRGGWRGACFASGSPYSASRGISPSPVRGPLAASDEPRVTEPRLAVLQCKFAAYLSWSQPFIHHLITGLDPYVRNIIACNRTENLDRFPVKEVVRFPDRYLFEPRLAVLAATNLRKRFAPDVIHAHFGWSGLRMLLLKQFLRVPMVVTFGGRDVGAQMRLPYFDRLYRVLLDASEQIVCVSSDLRSKLVDVGVPGDRIRVIYRGTNVEQFGWVDRSKADPARPLRVLTVGRLVEKKGHRYAFEALAELVRRGRAVELIVVGEGEDYPKIQGLRRRLGLRKQVEFVGSTNHAGVRRYMADADVLLHCSITPPSGDIEGIPNVVVEAQAMGLPVVATHHGGIVEAVRDKETGFLVAERDVAGLVEALDCLILDRERRLEMGRAARALVERDFNLGSQVAEHLEIYESLAKQQREGKLRERTWIPANYPELVRLTIRNHEEFSVAELLERFIWARRMETRFREPVQRESRLERFYALKKYVPQMIKYPVKLAVGRTLASAIEVRYRSRFGDNLETLESMDQRVLSFFREGGEMSVENEEWARIEDMLRSYPQVEQVETDSDPEEDRRVS